MEPVSPRNFLTRPKYLEKNEIQQFVASGYWARFSEIPVGFTGISPRCILSYLFSRKKLPLDSGNTVLFWKSSSSKEKSLSAHPLPMARGTFLDLWPSVCFSFCIVLLSCGAVSTGPEDTSETILVVLVDGVWTPTLLVTILQLSDIVVKFLPTYSSIVSNSLSSSSENLSCLAYLYVVVYAYCQKGWIIPFCPCIEEDQY
ncbi:unnamed protein product [Brassica rapa]|uniref:Uncharacterized protein n=1 Tax=Brassica campestris TaxID=3711 RepID=A0A8D9H638_BRACM|nr:unnamed protein product [Brassica rapa]